MLYINICHGKTLQDRLDLLQRVCSSDKMAPIYSIPLKFGACCITNQWSEFSRLYVQLLYVYIYFFGIFFVVFHHKTCFYHFYFFFFFYKVSNFRNRILTSQEHELVVSNCHRNCMQINKIYLANGDSNGTSNYFSCGDKKI